MSKDLYQDKIHSLPSIANHEIILGSSARGENFNEKTIETLKVSPTDTGFVIVENENLYNIDSILHFELIMDSYTLNPVKLRLLFRLKRYLIDNIRSKVLSSLKRNIKTASNSIQSEYVYRFHSNDYIQHTDTYFYISGQDQRSVKYTYLRFFQNLLLYLLVEKSSAIRLYFDEVPSIENKVTYLQLDNIFDVEDGSEIIWVYNSLLRIYNYGFNKYFNEGSESGTLVYEYPDSQIIIARARRLHDKLIDRFFTN